MPVTEQAHPTSAELRGFAQGRLPPGAMAQVESHVSTCDSCCQLLAKMPDDTLVQLAREAATQGFRADEKRTPSKSKSSAPKPPPDIPPELRDHPRYRVLGLVGVGGMGAVYKAEHRLMKRLVALKTISPAFLSNAAAVARFRNEFQSTARLSHPNVVTAFDADQAGDLHFLVMEFVEGMPLDRLVAQRGRLPIEQACQVFRQAAEGLAHIHDKRLVHRDIKPQNLMVGRSGVKILDCGLARPVSDSPHKLDKSANDPAEPHATSAGMILGTPDYIAPEQCADARAADIRSDIYSLGCTLYFALTGQPPFPHGSVVEKLTAHSNVEPPSLRTLRPDVPAELERIVSRMMAKDPAKRYQMPSDLARELAAIDVPQTSPPAIAVPIAPAASAPPLPSPVSLANLPPMPDASPLVQEFAVSPAAPSLSIVAHPPRKGQFSRRQAIPIAVALGIGIVALAAILSLPSVLPLPFRTPGGQGKAAVATYPRLPQRVLFIVPEDGLWMQDYRDVKEILEAEGIGVDTASTKLGRVTLAPDSAYGVASANLLVDGNLHHDDYGAVVFTGKTTLDFTGQGKAASDVRRLLAEFKAEKKLIGAICGGELVLARDGHLAGKKASRGVHFRPEDYAPNSEANWIEEEVVRDGLFLTAGSYQYAPQFAERLVAAIKE